MSQPPRSPARAQTRQPAALRRLPLRSRDGRGPSCAMPCVYRFGIPALLRPPVALKPEAAAGPSPRPAGEAPARPVRRSQPTRSRHNSAARADLTPGAVPAPPPVCSLRPPPELAMRPPAGARRKLFGALKRFIFLRGKSAPFSGARRRWLARNTENHFILLSP